MMLCMKFSESVSQWGWWLNWDYVQHLLCLLTSIRIIHFLQCIGFNCGLLCLQLGVLYLGSGITCLWLWYWSAWSKHLLAADWCSSYYGLPWSPGIYILDTICSHGRYRLHYSTVHLLLLLPGLFVAGCYVGSWSWCLAAGHFTEQFSCVLLEHHKNNFF